MSIARFAPYLPESQGASLAAPVEVGKVEGTLIESIASARTAPGKRSAGAVRADAMLFGVQGGASTPALPVPVGNTGTEFDSGVVHA